MGKKRLISALLSAAMVVTMVPFLVSADTDPNAPGSFADLQELIDTSTTTIVLDRDYVALPGEGSLKINVTRGIDLNGHTIDRNLSSAEEDGHVFFVTGDPTDPEYQAGTVTRFELLIQDSSPNKTGKITGGYAVNGGGFYCEYPARLNLQGITISGNRATSKGGGVYLDENVTYSTLAGTKVSGNSAEYGGGVYNASKDLFFRIYYNELCELSGNTAGSYGGGLYNANIVRVNSMDGITITGNTAGVHGGGVYQKDESTGGYGIFEIAGTVNISGNTGDNLYLCSGERVSVYSMLYEETKIGVTTEDPIPAVVTSNFPGHYPYGSNPTAYFFSDLPGYRINTDKDSSSSTSGEVIIEENTIGFVGCSVTLDGQIGLNVYADLSALTDEQKASAKVTFVVPGRGGNTQTDTFDADFTETVNDITCYGFTCKLSSIQMAEEIVPVLTYTGGSLTSTKAFSVANYLDSYFKTPGRTDYSAANLIPALGGYGYLVQQYLHELHGWNLGGANGYAEMPNLFSYSFDDTYYNSFKEKIETAGFKSSKQVGPSIDSVKYKLILDSTTDIEVTIKLKDGVTSDLSASCTYAGKTFTAQKSGEGEYKIRITGLYLQNLDDMITITGTVGDSEALTVRVSALGYVYASLDNPNATTAKKDAMCSLYNLWSYIEGYLESKNA
ncbi:MAG: hypothetical protein J5653_02075 [Clostridiales bacterium]|nr:hypothetical protein [Clostridiales bacterium]